VNAINELLREVIVEHQVAPGAVAGFATRSTTGWSYHVGHAGVMDSYTGDPVNNQTWYDLASITKSIVAVGLARAVDLNKVQWSDRLATHLPWVSGTRAASASLLSLISHRSGLQAHVPLFLPLVSGQRVQLETALAQAANSLAPSLPALDPGLQALEPYPALYSDLGYILAGEVLRNTCSPSLDNWLAAEFERLGLQGLASARQLEAAAIDVSQVAPTEVVAYRGGLIRGQVHDDNAWALRQNECTGHAGLFGTADGVLRFGTLMLDLSAGRSAALSPESTQELLRQRPEGSLRAGFDGKSTGASIVGKVLGPRTFGHLGFTGTSYWCDPDAECVVALLTNRVCPSRANLAIREARPLVHDALAEMAARLRASN
jgi:CubicO group peptidase (beta-lactamase class C family)